jgi:cytoplasmic iron level regulating protein YaaA (DUF328/UPF0246 family)
MRIVLPPSETKLSGGDGPPLDLDSLAFPSLTGLRSQLVDELGQLSRDTEAAITALKLGAKGEGLLAANREIATSPTLQAIARYTGVVYDALDYPSLDEAAKAHANQVLWVFSALFGPLRATDQIPNYRLSADSTLAGGKLAKRWGVVAGDIWPGGFTLDLRSEAYRQLAPLQVGSGVFVRMVTDGPRGRVSLGHRNKATKGNLVRHLVSSKAILASIDDLVAWGSDHGWIFEPGSNQPAEVWLVVR